MALVKRFNFRMEARSWGFPALLVLLCVTTAAGARSVPGYFENLSPSTYLPGQHVVLTVANPPDPVARIYALPLERAERTYRSVQWDPAAVEGLAPLASGRFRPQGDGHTQTLDVGPLAAGYYAVAIGDGKNRQQFGFCVSSFGLMSAGVGGETVLWAIDLRTYNTERQPITMSAGASDGGPRRTLRVGADAVALDTTEGRNGDQIAVATLPDGSVQIAGEYGYLGNLREGMFVSTDRPIYRPGQVVNIRAIVRNGGVGTYTIPRGTVHVRITPAGARRVLSDRTLSVSRFGTVSWAVRLPQNAATGPYQISLDDQHYAGHFDVEAYKKPEFTLQLTTKRAWTIAGEPTTVHVAARYLFGRAAAGLRLHYAVNAPGWYRPTRTMPLPLRSYWDIPPERSSDVADGDETTDSAGQVDLKFTAPAADREKLIAIRVDGLDASGQTVSTQLSLIDHAASFVVEAQPASWFVSVGRSSTIDIRTRNDDGTVRPKQTLTLTTRRLQWNDGRRRYDELGRASQTVVTAADGTAAVPWVPAEAGSYEFVVQGTDERARVTSGSVYAVASTAESAGSGVLPDRRIHIIPEKRTVAPGERARLLVVAPVADRDVLVAVCSDRLLRFRVVHLTGTAVTLEEPAPPDAARFTVSVAQADESGGSSDVALLTVDPPPHRLVVHVAASKARYAPGEVAQLRVDVRDSKGKPVRAEVGLGVVDEAIYALEEDRYVPFDAFYGYAAEAFAYGNWSTTVQPYFPRLRTIAYVSARAAVPPPRTSATSDAYGVRVRRNFLDTAFWAPSVITNARGHATVSFVWPDDLTTWRATGTAVTTATDVGTGTADALVTKDFLVRLATPRFLRVGDESSIVGIAQGRASHPSATLRLQANAPLSGTPSQRVTLDANGMASAAWRVRAGAIGSVLTTLYGSDGALSDAMQTRLPVEGATSEEHVFGAGSGNGRAQLSIPPGYGAGALTVTIAPSLLAQLMQSLHLLQVYPYDCTEQTLSAALPALFVERALEREHATADFPLHWRDIGYKALRRLNQLQHPDGSYGWWEHDAAHPFMTAYALYGLAELGKAGFSVDDQKTITNLIDQLQTSNDDTLRFWGGRQPGSEWNTRAFMLFALADAAPGRVPAEMLAEARAHATSMNAYALAVLGLAEHTVGDDASARQLLAALDARVSDDGTFAYWRGQTWEYAWEDDPIETTAYALRLQTALDPENPLTPRVVAFLRAQLRGGWAYTTKDTAATIYALSETQPMDAHELHPDETVRVALDGRIVRAIRVTAPVLDAGDAEVLVPADQIRDGSIVSVTGSGRGTFYWSTDLTRYVPPTARTAVDKETPLLERLFPPRPDVTISRRYIPQRPGPWRVGERVEVEVTVTSRRDLQYVAVDDPFPAGAEHPIDQGMAGADAWSRLQFLDDRASFFVQQLPAGQALQLHYALDLTTAGRYAAPPPALTSMYGPPVRVLGEAQTVTIDP